MYKILIRYTSTSKKIFWYEYESISPDGTSQPFSTDDLEVLKNEIKKIDSEVGYDSIRVVYDLTYDVLVDINKTIDIGDVGIATSEDVDNIYNTAFKNIFGGE